MTTTMITIKMSEVSPVKIDPEQWPLIVDVVRHNSDSGYRRWWIEVRKNADGRSLVYGACEEGREGYGYGFLLTYAGYLIEAGAPETETIRAIRRVAGVIDAVELGAEAIGKLPAREI